MIDSQLASALSDRYRIERELGAGGMATVYLAEDLKHDRKVALKVLRPELAAVLGADRFVVEIKTTAALQHPHILPLFDSGTAGGFLYYVMPFIDGETLRAKLDRETQMGVDQSVRIAIAIADALDYAHRHGVIHRDIKPENILLHDGRPMVADFGIALALSAAAGGRMTETGLSLGTPHYMSPEQATAEKEISGRSDIYSLASVLYEMLAGQPPHLGGSAQQIIMKIIAEQPALVTQYRRSVPPNVAAALARALEKLPADRFATANEFAEALITPAFGTSTTAAGGAATRIGGSGVPLSRGAALAAAVLLVMVGAAGGWGWTSGTGRPDVPEPTTFELAMGEPTGRSVDLRISPDGRRIIMSNEVSLEGPGALVRDLGSTRVVAVPGTEGARAAFFSPDGEWIVFNAGRGLWKVPAGGGPRLAIATDATGGAWLADGTIVFTRASDYGISVIDPAGGEPRRLVEPDTGRGEWGYWGLDPLPRGRIVLFTNYTAPIERSRIEAIDVVSGKRTVILENAIAPSYVHPGHLLFARDSVVYAVAFDARKLVVTGSPVAVLDDAFWDPASGNTAYDVSDNGTLVYVKGSEWNPAITLKWVSRTGDEQEAFSSPGRFSEPRIAPDGRSIALTVREGFPGLGILDLTRGILTMTERTPGAAFSPVWTHDSRTVVCTWEVRAYEVFGVRADGSSAPTPMIESPNDKYPYSVTANGLLAYDEMTGRVYRLMLASIDGRSEPRQLDSMSVSSQGSLSPDGRWIAFKAAVAGRPEVFVRASDGSGGRMRISSQGGSEPRWTRGGREIVYRAGNSMLAVSADPEAGSFSLPTVLFAGPYRRSGDHGAHDYDVTPDGSRFLMLRSVERPGALPVVVTIGWTEALKGKLR
jgi:eukaryotic-like serine/threonine-protein kinase